MLKKSLTTCLNQIKPQKKKKKKFILNSYVYVSSDTYNSPIWYDTINTICTYVVNSS